MATRARKILLGCGSGCLGLIVLSIGACVSFNIWIKQPGELLAPTRLLGQDTTGYVEWTLRVEDPGSEAFVGSLLDLQERLEAKNPQRAPAWLTQLLNSRREQKQAELVRQLMPSVVAWTVRAGETDDSDLHLFTVSMKSLGNRSRFLDLSLRYTLGLRHSVVHGDERIYSADEGAMFIRDNSFFFTNSLANARLAVDRLRGSAFAGASVDREAWDNEHAPTELEARLSILPGTPLKGAVGNARGELTRAWRSISAQDPDTTPPEVWSAIRGATLSGGFAGETAFEGVMVFEGPDAAWAQANAEGFGELLRADLGLGHTSADLQAEARSQGIRVTFRIDDVFAFLGEL